MTIVVRNIIGLVFWRRTRIFFGWSARRRGIVLEAAIALAVASLRLKLRPFREVAARIGQQQPTEFRARDHSVPREALRIAEAIAIASRNLPWSPKCLPQAIAAKRLLDRRGVGSALYFGVRPALSEFEAHAWVGVGGRIIVGDEASGDYQVLAVFS